MEPAQPPKNIKMKIRLVKGVHEPKIVDEATGGIINFRLCYLDEKRVKLSDLPEPPPASVLKKGDENTVLMSIWRKQIDEVAYVYTFAVPTKNLPSKIAVGSFLVPDENKKYKLSRLSPTEYRNKIKMERNRIRLGKEV